MPNLPPPTHGKPIVTPNPPPRQPSGPISAETTRTVTRTSPFGVVRDEVKKINVKVFVTEAAKVTVRAGRTINLGNYESARIDVEFEVPCYKEEMLDVYQETLAAAKELMAKEVESVEEAMKGELRKELE